MTDLAAGTDAASATRSWRTTLRRFLVLFSAEAIARGFGLVTIVVQARRLGPDGFGLVAVGLAITTWVGLVADAGTEVLTTRNVARAPSRFHRLAGEVLGLRIALALACAAVVIAGAALFAQTATSRAVYMSFGLVIPAAALNLRFITMGAAGARPMTFGIVASQAALLGGTLLLVHDHGDTTVVPFLYTGAELVFAGVVLGVVAHRFGLIRPRINLARWTTTLRASFPLMIGALARGAVAALDLAVVGIVLGPHDAGQYSAGSRPMLFLLTVAGLYFYSFMVSYAAVDGGGRPQLVRRSVRGGLAVSVPVALLLTLAAAPLIDLLFGARFDEAAVVLSILVWKVPAAALGSTFSGVLLAQGRQRTLMWIQLTGAAVAATVVIPAALTVGIVGVAAGSVAASAVVAALLVRVGRRFDRHGARP